LIFNACIIQCIRINRIDRHKGSGRITDTYDLERERKRKMNIKRETMEGGREGGRERRGEERRGERKERERS